MDKRFKLQAFFILLMFSMISLSVFAADKSVPQCSGEPMVDLEKIIPDAVLDIRYASENNFLKQKLYQNARCFLRQSVAAKLKLVADDLRKQDYRLILWDCYRPLSVQQKMWEIHPVAGEVANPRSGSNHNRGAAVDVALADMNGKIVELPTDFDYFGKKAWKDATKNISAKAIKHRTILQQAMKKQGFWGIRKEWWHFNTNKPRQYPICKIEF